MKIIDFISENRVSRLINLLNKALTTETSYSDELIIKNSKGSNFNAMVIVKGITDQNTNCKLCVLAVLDFTHQKMKEEMIRNSEERFKTMANTAPVMIWIADVEGLFSFVNNVWLNFAGGELGEQLGINWLNNVHVDDLENLVTQYQKALKDRKSFSIEFRFKDKNNNFQWMLIKGTPRLNGDNVYTGFIGSCINIDEQKIIEAKISNLNSELIQTIATKDKLFSIIAHDLRSPLSGILGILDILNSDYESLTEFERKEFISHAAVASKSTYSLMENLLEWSRIQTRKFKYHPERLKVQGIVENIINLFEHNLKSKEIELNNFIKPELYVFADKSMTESIFRNLISNAIKFTNKGGQISIHLTIEDGKAVINVRDTGVGIDQKNIPGLFHGETGNSTMGTERELGSGLGLIICKELVEEQKGKIWVESIINEGTTFYFSLPIVNY